MPERNEPVSARILAVKEEKDYIVEHLLLGLNPVEPVPAYFIRPRQPGPPWPVILYNHAHGGDYSIGKEELLSGRKELVAPSYAVSLARMGYAALAIDAWTFGERSAHREADLFKELLWQGKVLWGMMVYDSLRALDYLEGRDDTDADRIGTLGISMGSTMAWWVAALDERVRVCVDICCLTDFHALIRCKGLSCHSFYYFVPGLLKHFTTASINALIVPRPHLSLAGTGDPHTPPEGLVETDAFLKDLYREEEASDAWTLLTWHTGHGETIEMRQEVLRFFNKWL